MTRPRSPGVREGIVLRMQIQALVEQLLPKPCTRDGRQARMFGIADALCYELADRLFEEMAGECEPTSSGGCGISSVLWPPVTETTQ